MQVDPTNLIIYTHDDMVAGIKQIAAKVKESGFQPDLIVGVVRGGSVPAVYLSHYMKVPVHMTHWSLRDGQCANDQDAFVYSSIIKGKSILLVDDIVDGGDTLGSLMMDWVNNTLFECDPLKNVRVASLWYNPAQNVIVDYFHHTINREEDSRWIHFCWEG